MDAGRLGKGRWETDLEWLATRNYFPTQQRLVFARSLTTSWGKFCKSTCSSPLVRAFILYAIIKGYVTTCARDHDHMYSFARHTFDWGAWRGRLSYVQTWLRKTSTSWWDLRSLITTTTGKGQLPSRYIVLHPHAAAIRLHIPVLPIANLT